MKTLYKADEYRDLVDKDGERLGLFGMPIEELLETLVCVTAITIDTSLASRARGGALVSGLTSTEETTSTPTTTSKSTPLSKRDEESRPTATQLEREAVTRIWAYWLEVSGKKQRIDAKRTRIIRNAIHLVGEDATKLALLGLTRSPHHQGQNEQRKAYMEIRYALKGLGDESDEERIEKAITWAASFSPTAVGVDPAKTDRWLEQVRYHLSKQAVGSTSGRELAVEAYRKLAGAGFDIVRLDKAPWARITAEGQGAQANRRTGNGAGEGEG